MELTTHKKPKLKIGPKIKYTPNKNWLGNYIKGQIEFGPKIYYLSQVNPKALRRKWVVIYCNHFSHSSYVE